MIKFRKIYLIGISLGLFTLALDVLYFLHTRWFFAFIVVALSIAWLQFWIDFFKELSRQKNIETKFLEFIRNLIGNIKSEIAVPQAIINVSKGDYGELNPYLEKLRKQIEWGISIKEALITFGKDTNNIVIRRSVDVIIEAEKSGGRIESVLDAISNSVLNIKKMKQERKAIVYSQIVQGYTVFFIFISVMLILQAILFPQLEKMGTSLEGGLGSMGVIGFIGSGEKANLDLIFLSLILVQGFFAGIVIGKFSEGTLKQGLIHSLVLMTLSALIVTIVKGGI